MDPVQQVLSAQSPKEVFGALPDGSFEEQERALKKAFRLIAKKIHGDVNSSPDAKEAFIQLQRLHTQAALDLKAGRYGHTKTTVLKVSGVDLLVETQPAFGGDSADYYSATRYKGDADPELVLVKIARSPKARSLMENEVSILQEILSDPQALKSSAFYPSPIESFKFKDGSRVRAATIFRRPWTNLYDLNDVRKRYPLGIDAKDMAWMFRRLLFVVGLTHRQGILHGAILPRHILIEPEQHGVILVDWKHAQKFGRQLKKIPKGSRAFYPPEVLEHQELGPPTDIWMAVSAMLRVFGPHPQRHVPKPILNFIRGCLQESPASRPQDAWALSQEFDELIGRLWGPRRFHEFEM